jgi:hypothetical protein
MLEIIASHYPSSELIRRLPEYGTPSGLVRVTRHLDPNPLRLDRANGLDTLGAIAYEYGICIQGTLPDEMRRILLIDGAGCFQNLRRLELPEEQICLIKSNDYWTFRLE